MKLDSSIQEDAQRLAAALVERANEDGRQLRDAAQDAVIQLEAKALAVDDLNKGAEKTLLGTAEALYASEFTVEDSRLQSAPGRSLEHLELRFEHQHVVKLADDRNTGRHLPPGRYRALLVFTRIGE
jgi:hypothetical protein